MQSALQFVGDNPADGVVAAQQIAVRNNDHPRHFGCRIELLVTWSALPSPLNLVQ
jgi:hypothetical protein